MESIKFSTALSLIGLAIVFSNPRQATASPPHWEYSEETLWGALEDTSQTTAPLLYPFAECGIGVHQSPLDLNAPALEPHLNRIRFRYIEDMPDFFNSGHAIQVNTSGSYSGGVYLGRDFYPLIQFHFHTPSEHRLNDQTFAAELHFVHIRSDGKMLVVGVPVTTGEENPSVQVILDKLPALGGTHNASTGIRLNPTHLLPRHPTRFYTYAGSLTTPPCSEGVNWYVLGETLSVSPGQLAQLQGFYLNNNRPTQALNGRAVARTARD